MSQRTYSKNLNYQKSTFAENLIKENHKCKKNKICKYYNLFQKISKLNVKKNKIYIQ